MEYLTAFLFLLIVSQFSSHADTIWPIPADVRVLQGSPFRIHSEFTIIADTTSPVVADAIERYTKIIRIATGNTSDDEPVLYQVEILLTSQSEALNWDTDYSYELQVKGSGVITAATPYGAVYGLETLSQLIVDGELQYSHIWIVDRPKFRHRGFLIDSGRRIYPKFFVLQLLDALSYLKMNVLHLHLSDYCRFSIVCNVFPNLQTPAVDEYYTHEDIREIVEYARLRGIRVVPEIDVPGHSGGFSHLNNRGVKFCNNELFELYNDPHNETQRTLEDVIEAMASLFPDKLFHVGCDETSQIGNCTLENIASLEREVIDFVTSLGKVPVGWEEVLFESKAATAKTVVNDWTRYFAIDSVREGYLSIESHGGYFYLNHVDYDDAWVDIAPNFTESQLSLLLGGEMAMWTDNYCNCSMCPSDAPAKWMYDRKHDAVFAQSVGGMIWPRGIAAAGSFWNYIPTLNPQSNEFRRRYDAQNKRMAERGIITCPVGCKCDELTVCGARYLQF